MKKLSVLLLCLLVDVLYVNAQIGYQISLLNTATGAPRANETVTVSVSLSNNANEVFYSETKSATTNDFGVLSLSIGNADTFKNVDLSKMPFFIEVTANGVMIGKSQMLSVPMAEVAKQLAPIDKSLIVGTWDTGTSQSGYSYTIDLAKDGSWKRTEYDNRNHTSQELSSGNYIIHENHIIMFREAYEGIKSECFVLNNGKLYSTGGYVYLKQ